MHAPGSTVEADHEDVERLRRVAAGDRRALQKLYHDYHRRVFAYVHRFVADAGLAEETMNDVFFEVWKQAARFEGRSRVSTWIFGIARFKALNAVRGRRLETSDLDDARAVAAEAATDASAVERDRREALERALRELSVEHREVVQLAFYEGLSYQEIARIAECPVNTVKTRMFYARERLREILPALGVAEAP